MVGISRLSVNLQTKLAGFEGALAPDLVRLSPCTVVSRPAGRKTLVAWPTEVIQSDEMGALEDLKRVSGGKGARDF